MMEKNALQELMRQAAHAVRQDNPLVGSITNAATVNLVANAQIAVGGSAAMVYLPDEGEFLARAGAALYINMGTLLPIHEEALPRTAAMLHDLGKPWVLDPVGIGIGSLRESLLLQFKAYRPSIIRANASEVIALARLWELAVDKSESGVHGVDSTDEVSDAKAAAIALAQWTGGAVAVSGEVDLVTDGVLVARSQGGSHFMEKITGAGCSLGGVAAVYATAATPFVAALTATAAYNLAGCRAERVADAPASFQVAFLDELYRATPQNIAENPFDIKEI